MLGIPVALAVFGVGEWATHKYLLHGLGRDKTSRFAFHYHQHHQAVRKHGGYDETIRRYSSSLATAPARHVERFWVHAARPRRRSV